MNNFNEYERLRNLYLKMIIIAATVTPLLFILFKAYYFLVLTPVVLIANLYVYLRYYKKNDMGLFQENIKKIIKKFLVCMVITAVSLLPLGYTFLIIGSGQYYSTMMIAGLSFLIGTIISFIYYLYSLIKSLMDLNKNDFYQDMEITEKTKTIGADNANTK